MKIHITENIDKVIEGFTMIPIIYGKIDVGQVPNNSARQILASDAMDSVPVELVTTFVENIASKMRIGCQLMLGGTDINIVSKDLLSGKINTAEYNKMVLSKRGLYSINDVLDLLRSNGMNIYSANLRGHAYEICATRPDKN